MCCKSVSVNFLPLAKANIIAAVLCITSFQSLGWCNSWSRFAKAGTFSSIFSGFNILTSCCALSNVQLTANESKEIKARREGGAGTTVIYVDNIKTAENPDAEYASNETESGGTEVDSGDDAASSSVGAAGPGVFLLAFLYWLRRRISRLSA